MACRKRRKNVGEEILLTGNTTIKAIWQDDQIMREYQVYDLKFDLNFISGNIDIQNVDGVPEYELFRVDEAFFSDMIPSFKRGELAAIEINGVRKELGFGFVIKEDTTLKFIWNLVGERANVTFKMNNSSNDEFQMNVKKNTKLTSEFLSFPSEGYLEGKVVKEIIINGVTKNPDEITEIIITEDTTIEFIWKNRDKVKITFNPGNGGSGTMPDVEVDKGTMYMIPPSQFTPPPGKEFRIWLYSGVEKPVGSVIFPERNIELKASWQDAPAVAKVKVSFHANGGFGPMEEQEVEKNSNYTLPPNEFLAPHNKEFKAWLVGTEEKAVGDVIKVTENTVVKAIWKDAPTVEKVTVSFNANGGSGSMGAKEVNKNSNYTLPANGFTAPDGKEFKAWLVGTQEKAVGDIITVSANTTIKALWKEKATVTPPSSGGGSSYSPVRPDTGSGTSGGSTGSGLTTTGTSGGSATIVTSSTETRFKIGSRTFNKTVNGVPTTIDMGIAPYIRNGRVMVPLRFVGEAIGYEAKWNPTTRTVTLENKDNKIEVPINTNNIIVNGKTYTGDVRPTLESGRVMLPIGNIIRALGENSEATIKWEPTTQEIVVNK